MLIHIGLAMIFVMAGLGTKYGFTVMLFGYSWSQSKAMLASAGLASIFTDAPINFFLLCLGAFTSGVAALWCALGPAIATFSFAPLCFAWFKICEYQDLLVRERLGMLGLFQFFLAYWFLCEVAQWASPQVVYIFRSPVGRVGGSVAFSMIVAYSYLEGSHGPTTDQCSLPMIPLANGKWDCTLDSLPSRAWTKADGPKRIDTGGPCTGPNICFLDGAHNHRTPAECTVACRAGYTLTDMDFEKYTGGAGQARDYGTRVTTNQFLGTLKNATAGAATGAAAGIAVAAGPAAAAAQAAVAADAAAAMAAAAAAATAGGATAAAATATGTAASQSVIAAAVAAGKVTAAASAGVAGAVPFIAAATAAGTVAGVAYYWSSDETQRKFVCDQGELLQPAVMCLEDHPTVKQNWRQECPTEAEACLDSEECTTEITKTSKLEGSWIPGKDKMKEMVRGKTCGVKALRLAEALQSCMEKKSVKLNAEWTEKGVKPSGEE